MSALAEIQRRIQSTSALIAKHESVIASSPPNRPNPLSINVRALEKLKRRLEAQFAEIAQEQALEVYRYRLIEIDDERTGLAGVAEAWGKFQGVFGEVYAALQRAGKKAEGQPSPLFGLAMLSRALLGLLPLSHVNTKICWASLCWKMRRELCLTS